MNFQTNIILFEYPNFARFLIFFYLPLIFFLNLQLLKQISIDISNFKFGKLSNFKILMVNTIILQRYKDWKITVVDEIFHFPIALKVNNITMLYQFVN